MAADGPSGVPSSLRPQAGPQPDQRAAARQDLRARTRRARRRLRPRRPSRSCFSEQTRMQPAWGWIISVGDLRRHRSSSAWRASLMRGIETAARVRRDLLPGRADHVAAGRAGSRRTRPAPGPVAVVPRDGGDLGRGRRVLASGSRPATCSWRRSSTGCIRADARRAASAPFPPRRLSTPSYAIILGGAVLILITLLRQASRVGRRARRTRPSRATPARSASTPPSSSACRSTRSCTTACSPPSSRPPGRSRPTSGPSPPRWPGTRCRT